jgi:hypothetical protein
MATNEYTIIPACHQHLSSRQEEKSDPMRPNNLSRIDSPTTYDIRIFLIFVVNSDRNENNYRCIRGSF